MAIHKFATMLARGKPIPMFGDGSTARDYTYVDDIVQGVVAAMEPPKPYAIYNLGGAATTSLSELVQHLEQALDKRAKLQRLPDQPGDVPVTYADVALAAQDLGYRCTTPLAQGIQKFCEWYVREKREGRVP